jgi:DNA repair protein RadC
MATQAAVLVAYGEYGRRVGESHHRSSISDAMVEKLRDLREFEHLTYLKISEVTGVGLGSVAKICTYERRNARVASYKMVAGG